MDGLSTIFHPDRTICLEISNEPAPAATTTVSSEPFRSKGRIVLKYNCLWTGDRKEWRPAGGYQMKRRDWFILLLLGSLLIGTSALAQDIYIYPSKGQSQAQQDKDRYDCHSWAVKETGFDPSGPQTTSSNPSTSNQYQPSQPHVLKGAARGAALGTVGGAIAGNAGKGAAAGAAMGGVAGGFRRVDERRQQTNQQQANAQASQQNQQMAYRRAMAACLEGRGYTVK